MLHDLNEFHDLGLDETNLIIDRSKIRRERKKSRNQTDSCFNDEKLWCLSFDGRRDNTMTQYKDEETKTYHRRVLRKEHITLLKETGSTFIGFISTIGEDAQTISNAIYENLKKIEAPLHKLRAIGSDGTPVNTGHSGGTITFLEQSLGHSLQWFICLLHFNELSLKHIIKKVYGIAQGPNVFGGSITKTLKNCESLPIVKFKAIPTVLPEIDYEDLSTDQKYLWEIANAISTGICSKALALKQPGTISLSRWNNTSSRFLRVYASTESPSSNLIEVVNI